MSESTEAWVKKNGLSGCACFGRGIEQAIIPSLNAVRIPQLRKNTYVLQIRRGGKCRIEKEKNFF